MRSERAPDWILINGLERAPTSERAPVHVSCTYLERAPGPFYVDLLPGFGVRFGVSLETSLRSSSHMRSTE